MLKVEIFESAARFYGNSLANSFVHVAINDKLILSAIKTDIFVMGDEELEIDDNYETTYDILDERGDVIYTTRYLKVVQEFAIQMSLTGAQFKHIVRFFNKRANIFAQLRADNNTFTFTNCNRMVAIIKSTGEWGTILRRKGNKVTLAIHDNTNVTHEFTKKELAVL